MPNIAIRTDIKRIFSILLIRDKSILTNNAKIDNAVLNMLYCKYFSYNVFLHLIRRILCFFSNLFYVFCSLLFYTHLALLKLQIVLPDL